MSKLFVFLLFSFVSFTGFSQKVYFVYLQTEDQQAFFVKMDGKTRSSTASGYLILSKLRDTIYNFTIGFPLNKWPEQNFSITLNRKDHGYLLKNFGEKGWGLFDLQTLAVQMAESGSAKVEERNNEENKDISVFTEILSKAADDPSLKEKPAKTETGEKKVEIVIQEKDSKDISIELSKDKTAIKPVEKNELAEVKKDELKIENLEQPAGKLIEETVTLVADEYKPTMVIKRSESSTTEGFGLVFIDNQKNGISDTIRLIIPDPKFTVAILKEEPKEEKRFLDILQDTAKKKEENVVDTISVVAINPVEKKELKNNCPVIAEEIDFFKLRKNMASTEGDDNMLNEAKNYFQTKCFTTEKVKNLGLLFLNDKGKFNFFELAYGYVIDTDKFSVLQNELKDEYYINSFKALLRN